MARNSVGSTAATGRRVVRGRTTNAWRTRVALAMTRWYRKWRGDLHGYHLTPHHLLHSSTCLPALPTCLPACSPLHLYHSSQTLLLPVCCPRHGLLHTYSSPHRFAGSGSAHFHEPCAPFSPHYTTDNERQTVCVHRTPHRTLSDGGLTPTATAHAPREEERRGMPLFLQPLTPFSQLCPLSLQLTLTAAASLCISCPHTHTFTAHLFLFTPHSPCTHTHMPAARWDSAPLSLPLTPFSAFSALSSLLRLTLLQCVDIHERKKRKAA